MSQLNDAAQELRDANVAVKEALELRNTLEQQYTDSENVLLSAQTRLTRAKSALQAAALAEAN